MNRLKTLHLGLTRRLTNARLAQSERQIAALEAEIEARTRACTRRARAQDILMSIPGFGRTSANAILAECLEVGTLGAKHAAALAGLAPMTQQSGTWRGREVIQGGRSHLRKAIDMSVLVAMKHNPDLAAKYDALRAAGKPHKVALTVIMRKLIRLANSRVAQDREWFPDRA